MTDYTDPDSVDVDEVMANIRHSWVNRGDEWDDRPSWPDITVLALAHEVLFVRGQVKDLRRQLHEAESQVPQSWER